MNDEPRFDATDAELTRRFRAGAAGDADPDVVLDGLRPQLQHARTRRRRSIAGATAGLAAVVVALVVALGAGGGGGGGSVGTPPASEGPSRTTPSVSTTTPAGGSPTPDTTPTTTPDDHGDDAVTTPTASTPTQAPAPTTVAPPAASDTPYSSAGGSIVVHFADGQVSLASSSPAAGYTLEIHDNGPTRVEVRFNNGSTEHRIRVDVDNGQLVAEVT